jgi:hypothetical protein
MITEQRQNIGGGGAAGLQHAARERNQRPGREAVESDVVAAFGGDSEIAGAADIDGAAPHLGGVVERDGYGAREYLIVDQPHLRAP